jgi:hypothetical protein
MENSIDRWWYIHCYLGYFSGQHGYGYRSFEVFIDAVADLNEQRIDMKYCDRILATIGTTLQETAVLEAGRISLDNQSATVEIIYENDTTFVPIELRLVKWNSSQQLRSSLLTCVILPFICSLLSFSLSVSYFQWIR